MTDKPPLKAATVLAAVLDMADYAMGACHPNEAVAAVLPQRLLVVARAARRRAQEEADALQAEDWENACHGLIWEREPAAFEAIRAEAERHRVLRISARGQADRDARPGSAS